MEDMFCFKLENKEMKDNEPVIFNTIIGLLSVVFMVYFWMFILY